MAILPLRRESPIESRNGSEEASQVALDPSSDPFRGLVPAKKEDALGISPRDPTVGGANRAVEDERLALQSIRRPAEPNTRQTGLRGQIEDVGAGGLESARGEADEGPHRPLPQPAAAALIGNRRIAETIGDNHPSSIEGRLDLVGDKLCPRGEVKE
jgi:hypothetical protein